MGSRQAGTRRGSGIPGALLLAGFAPRRVARAQASTSLGRAYLAHLLGLAASSVVLLAVLSRDPVLGADLAELLNPHVLLAPVGLTIVLASLAAVELGFVLLAVLLLPWGDADAPVRPLWRQALRTVWLHTGQVGLTAGVLVALQVAGSNLWSLLPQHGNRWPPETTPSLLIWLVDNYIDLLPWLYAGGVAWWVWALLRAMTTRLTEPEERAPLCESCGYNLSHHEMSGRCPECGRPVAQSLAEGRRSPVRWGPFAHGLHPTGFARATWEAWFAPRRFFGSLSARTGLVSAGAFLLAHVGLTAVGFSLGICTGVGVVVGEDIPADAFYVVGWVGAFVATVCGVFMCGVAAVAGWILSRDGGRNVTGATLRVACFCAGIFPPYVFCWVLSLFGAFEIVEVVQARGSVVYNVLVGGFVGLAVLLGGLYVTGVMQRVRHVRYANE